MADGINVEKVGRCVVVRMERGENRQNMEFVEAMNRALDQAESYEDAVAMVMVGKGKYFSLGVDLEKMMTMSAPEIMKFSDELQKLICRLLTFPLVTVAAINGHTYAGGAFLAMVLDYRVMRTQQGWYCMSEVHIKRNFTAGFVEILKARFPRQSLHEAVVLGRRYTAEEAKEAGIVDEVCPMSKLEETALSAATRLAGKDGLDRRILSSIKYDLYRDACITLNEPVKFYSRL